MDAVDDVPDVSPDALRELGGRRLTRGRFRLLALLGLATVLLAGVAVAALLTSGGPTHAGALTSVGTGPATSLHTVSSANVVSVQTVFVVASAGGGSDGSSGALVVSAISGVAALLTGVAALLTALRAPRADPAPAGRRRR